ncbi:MAG: DUF4974 domain-containing protein [Pedobacter sp.]|nr:MAG: DUF4974 domain-containing protein [Pedobacter sp.]
MIVSYIKNLINKKRGTDAEEMHIDSTIADFRQNPKAWNEAEMGKQYELQERILSRLKSSMLKSEKDNRTNYRRALTAAASIAMLTATAWYGFQYREAILDLVDPATLVVVKTEKNQLKKVILSDGSVIWLNGNSALSYPDRFGDAKREVSLLNGEAYFDVHHDEKKPFQVKAGKTLTNVLGTAFNISAYSWLETINITVTKGKVAVNKSILLPNDQLSYNKSTGQSEKKKLLGDHVILWMKGRLAFNDESFKAVAAILENKYPISIRFGDEKMEDFRFTARFEPSDKLNDILDALTMTRGLSYEVKGAVITIINNQPN